MITFDKIKIVTKLDYLTITNKSVFEKRENELKNSTVFVYNQNKPFSLFIHLTPALNKAVIEFTGKILLENYSKLISSETISQCFQNVNNMGFCRLQVENIVGDSELIKCDVTKDLELDLKCDVKRIIISQLSNHKKFITRKYSTTGYTVTKDVKTKKFQLRLSLYDKYRDMLKSENSDYLKLVPDAESIMNYFKNKYRIEVNLIQKEQIRKYLGIPDNSLVNALNSNSNPLLTIFNAMFNSSPSISDGTSKTRNLFDYESFNRLKDGLIVKACDYDLKKVNDVLNHYLATNTNKRKYNARFREIINESIPINENKFIIKHIRDQLIA